MTDQLPLKPKSQQMDMGHPAERPQAQAAAPPRLLPPPVLAKPELSYCSMTASQKHMGGHTC